MIISHIVNDDETTRLSSGSSKDQRAEGSFYALPVPLYADLVDVATQIVDIVTVIKFAKNVSV